MIVYAIKNKINDKIYVGSTVEFEKRIARHFKELSSGIHHSFLLQDEFNDLGLDNFFVDEISRHDNEDELRQAEQDQIDMIFGTNICLNVSPYASFGDIMSVHPNREEIILKIKRTLSETISSMTTEERSGKYGRNGELNGMFGRNHTDESKKLMSDSALLFYAENGHPLSGKTFDEMHGVEKAEEMRKNLSNLAKSRTGSKNSFYGKAHSEETKKKLSELARGRKSPNGKKISIDGTIYESATEAAKLLGIKLATLTYRARSKSFDNYFYC